MNDDRTQIEEVKSRIDIESVVERYVTLKKTGKNYVGLCPFHAEKTPSFTVTPSVQLYKCFGCGESGDVIKFLEKVEHLEFIDALEKLAKEAGVELSKKPKDKNSIYAKLEEINELATQFFQMELENSTKAKKYLKEERKFDNQTIKDFRLGYAPGGRKLQEFLKSKNKYTKKELLTSSLFTQKQENIYERYFNRIIFPIKDHRGTVVGFTGRSLPDNDYGPKYLHTAETPIFKKSQLMYGIDQGKMHMREQDLCIVCEGTTDVISAHQEGLKNVIAPLGTAVTEEQLKLVARYTKNILLILDSDEAGEKALERYFLLGMPLNLNIYTNTPAPYKDIDELVKKDKNKIQDIIERKQDLFSHLLIKKIEEKDISKHKDYKEIIEYTSYLLAHVPDKPSQEFFLKKAEELTTIERHLFSLQDSKTNSQTEQPQYKSEKLENEFFLLTLIIYFKDNTVIQQLDLKYLFDEDIKEVLEYIQTNKDWTEEKLLEEFSHKIDLKKAIVEATGLNIPSPKKEKYILNTFSIIKKQNIEKMIHKLKIKEKIAIEKGEDDRIDKIEGEIVRLKKLLEQTKM